MYVLWVFSGRHGIIHTESFQKLLLQNDVAEPGNKKLSIMKYTSQEIN